MKKLIITNVIMNSALIGTGFYLLKKFIKNNNETLNDKIDIIENDVEQMRMDIKSKIENTEYSIRKDIASQNS